MIETVLYEDGVRSDEPVQMDALASVAVSGRGLLWADVVDPSDEDLALLARGFDLHPLVLEDARHRRQRAKIEPFPGYVHVVLRTAQLDGDLADPAELIESEIHAFVGPGSFLTLRFSPVFDIDDAAKRWEGQPSMLREGSGFALYVLVDHVVDQFLSAVERFEELTDALEDDVFVGPDGGAEDPSIRERLFTLKRDAVRIRRFVSPLREGIDLVIERPELASAPLVPYFRDVRDHVIRTSELLDNVRDLLTSLQELRVAQIANRTNEVMKSLTAWATILLVPTLFAGVWGMNFRRMPELGWRYGYLFAIGTIVGSAFGLYAWFRWKKRWL